MHDISDLKQKEKNGILFFIYFYHIWYLSSPLPCFPSRKRPCFYLHSIYFFHVYPKPITLTRQNWSQSGYNAADNTASEIKCRVLLIFQLDENFTVKAWCFPSITDPVNPGDVDFHSSDWDIKTITSALKFYLRCCENCVTSRSGSGARPPDGQPCSSPRN